MMAEIPVHQTGHVGRWDRGYAGDDPWQLHWGAIFGGAFVALGVWALLYVFGLAVGLVGADGDTGSFRIPTLFIGIWSIISPLIALLAGGYVAARTAGSQDRVSGALHGAVLWGLTMVLGMVAVWMLVTALISGLVGLGQSAAGAAGQVPMPNIQASQLLEPVNRMLQERGLPPLSENELQAVAEDIGRRAVEEGRIDSRMIEQALTANTRLEQQDIREIAGEIERQIQQALGEGEQAVAAATEGTGQAMWGLFFVLLLGLAAAIGGAVMGISKQQRMLAAEKVH
jgi:hypothetical protein